MTKALVDKEYAAKVIKAEAKDVITKSAVVLFWGGWPSQWYPSIFTVDGIGYNCAEQYMMHQKALFFGDEATAAKIMKCKYAKAQKELGRSAGPFNPDWDKPSGSRAVVYRGTLAKFSQDPKLKALLLATKGCKIGEASPYDDLWGIGLDVKHKDAFTPAKWAGKNWLGEALMKVRAKL